MSLNGSSYVQRSSNYLPGIHQDSEQSWLDSQYHTHSSLNLFHYHNMHLCPYQKDSDLHSHLEHPSHERHHDCFANAPQLVWDNSLGLLLPNPSSFRCCCCWPLSFWHRIPCSPCRDDNNFLWASWILMSWYLCITAAYSVWGRFFSVAIIAQQSRVEEKQEELAVATAARPFSSLRQKKHT